MSPATQFDLALFEELNREYERKPIVPVHPALDHSGRAQRARKRLRKFRRWADLEGGRVLELGCGTGHMARAMVRRAGASEVVGVDVREYPTWEQFQGKKVRLLRADLSAEEPFDPGSFDAVVSSAVMEHVRRPLAMIDAIARLLKPGGQAALYFNLHRGPRASHRYREVFFPWPHLLFEPGVCEAFYRKHHESAWSFAWVNRMTAGEYLHAFDETGLEVTRLRRHTLPFDLSFYLRFEERLGRYPALDLETDFLTVALRKPKRRGRSGAGIRLDYVARQRQLEADLAPLRREAAGN